MAGRVSLYCRLHSQGGRLTGLVLLLALSCIGAELGNPPFKNNYRFDINTSYIKPVKGIAVPFACSWSGVGSVACAGTTCGGQPLTCARVNASYLLLTGEPPASCTWTLNGPCRAMPTVHAGVCMTHLVGAYESVSEPLTPELFALAMNNCSDQVLANPVLGSHAPSSQRFAGYKSDMLTKTH
jgi:hypothetical protein